MRNKTVTICTVSLLVLLMWAGIGLQGAWGADDIRFIKYQGKVTETGSGYYIASSRKIELMDIVEGGKQYTTDIFDIKGKKIEPKDVRKGDVLWVIGQVLPNRNILANTIYLQTHE